MNIQDIIKSSEIIEHKFTLKTVVLETPDGKFVGYIREYPGICTQSDSKEEMLESLNRALLITPATVAMSYQRAWQSPSALSCAIQNGAKLFIKSP